MILKSKELMFIVLLFTLSCWIATPVWTITFDCDALNNYSAAHIDCLGETAKNFQDETGQYSLTVDQKDMSGECNTGYDRLRLEDENGVELWSVNVKDGTAGDYVRNSWDNIFPEDIPSVINTPTMLRVSTSQTVSLISKYIARIMMPRGSFTYLKRQLEDGEDDGQKEEELKSGLVSGLAAGDQASGLSFWANTGYDDWQIDDRKSESDGYLSTVIVGADYRPLDSVVLGLSLIYEHSGIDTDYNNGDLDQDGITIAP